MSPLNLNQRPRNLYKFDSFGVNIMDTPPFCGGGGGTLRVVLIGPVRTLHVLRPVDRRVKPRPRQSDPSVLRKLPKSEDVTEVSGS